MREIKFRAWDGNKMLVSPISSNYGLNRFFGLLYEDAILMQFTGLKDKNGVEIYEGDIITYDNSGYCFKVEYEAPEFVRHTTNYDLRSQSVPFKSHHAYEVIGNIHTNPELLK